MKNRHVYLFVAFILGLSNFSVGQDNNWEWTRAFGGNGADEIMSACTDAYGNIYVAGYFQNEIDIDGNVLKSNGDNDILIAKFSKQGNLVWAKRAGGTYSENLIISEYAKKIKLDNEGNLIVAGCFMWEADFDGYTVQGPGNSDIFIAKYTTSGSLLWAKAYGSKEHDYLFDMDIDDNNIFITGQLTGPFISDAEVADNNSKISIETGTTPIIAGFDFEGNLKWMRRDIGKVDKTLLSTDNNNLYYALEFSSDLLIGNNMHQVTRNKDFIIQCLSKQGNLVWERKFSSENNELIESIEADGKGGLLISGKYGNIPELKSIRPENQAVNKDTYFSKIGMDGSISWSENNNSPGYPGGTKFSSFNENTYFSVDVYSKPVTICGVELIPDGKWHNSYLAFHDAKGRITEVMANVPGIIKEVISLNKIDFLIIGNYLSSANAPYDENTEGGFIDFFMGMRKLPESKNLTNVPTGIAPFEFEVTLSPNPTSDYCTVNVVNISTADEIIIADINGKVLDRYFLCTTPFQMATDNLARGTYFISVKFQAIVVTKKLVVE
jgi:hypothetical protein